MKPKLREAFEAELELARAGESDEDFAHPWHHLERAHVLSQAYAWPHVRVHGRMLCLALRQRDLRELVGQVSRLLLAAPGSWTGRAPLGNTGASDVGIFVPMPIPDDLAALLRESNR